MKTFEGNGVRLAYDDRGSASPTVLFVHGWSCDRSFFAPQLDHFEARHRVVAVDLRGHGESGLGAGYSIDDFADDLVALSSELGLGKPVVVGHSMGGVIALALGSRDAAAAAVMVDPAPMVDREASVSVLNQLVDSWAADEDGAARGGFAQGMFLPTDDPERRRQIVAGMASTALPVAVAALRGIFDFDCDGALRACEVPLLSIGSAAPSNDAARLKERCPTITIGQTVGSGHFNQLEVPDQVNAMIERFLMVNRLTAGS